LVRSRNRIPDSIIRTIGAIADPEKNLVRKAARQAEGPTMTTGNRRYPAKAGERSTASPLTPNSARLGRGNDAMQSPNSAIAASTLRRHTIVRPSA